MAQATLSTSGLILSLFVIEHHYEGTSIVHMINKKATARVAVSFVLLEAL